jgi:hypothetical protein
MLPNMNLQLEFARKTSIKHTPLLVPDPALGRDWPAQKFVPDYDFL